MPRGLIFKLGAMTRVTISIWFVAITLLCRSTFAAPLPKDEVVGTYRIDPSTLHGQTVPTNFFSFAITLSSDGSFSATNVPADFFFSYTPTTATAEARGTWKLDHRSEGRSLVYTGENDYLVLDFTSAPGPGSYSTLVESARRGSVRIYMCYHSGKKDAVVFYLRREKR